MSKLSHLMHLLGKQEMQELHFKRYKKILQNYNPILPMHIDEQLVSTVLIRTLELDKVLAFIHSLGMSKSTV